MKRSVEKAVAVRSASAATRPSGTVRNNSTGRPGPSGQPRRSRSRPNSRPPLPPSALASSRRGGPAGPTRDLVAGCRGRTRRKKRNLDPGARQGQHMAPRRCWARRGRQPTRPGERARGRSRLGPTGGCRQQPSRKGRARPHRRVPNRRFLPCCDMRASRTLATALQRVRAPRPRTAAIRTSAAERRAEFGEAVEAPVAAVQSPARQSGPAMVNVLTLQSFGPCGDRERGARAMSKRRRRSNRRGQREGGGGREAGGGARRGEARGVGRGEERGGGRGGSGAGGWGRSGLWEWVARRARGGRWPPDGPLASPLHTQAQLAVHLSRRQGTAQTLGRSNPLLRAAQSKRPRPRGKGP